MYDNAFVHSGVSIFLLPSRGCWGLTALSRAGRDPAAVPETPPETPFPSLSAHSVPAPRRRWGRGGAPHGSRASPAGAALRPLVQLLRPESHLLFWPGRLPGLPGSLGRSSSRSPRAGAGRCSSAPGSFSRPPPVTVSYLWLYRPTLCIKRQQDAINWCACLETESSVMSFEPFRQPLPGSGVVPHQVSCWWRPERLPACLPGGSLWGLLGSAFPCGFQRSSPPKCLRQEFGVLLLKLFSKSEYPKPGNDTKILQMRTREDLTFICNCKALQRYAWFNILMSSQNKVK